jgi:hypothetical protein
MKRGKIMKKIIMIMVSMTIVFTMANLVYAQTSGAKWPPKPMAAAVMSCENNLGAEYPLSGGKTDIYCATKTATGGYTNLKIANCLPQGAQQKCTGGVIVNHYDFPAAKLQKVCAPTCTSWK